jgi:hypothetical protein
MIGCIQTSLTLRMLEAVDELSMIDGRRTRLVLRNNANFCRQLIKLG